MSDNPFTTFKSNRSKEWGPVPYQRPIYPSPFPGIPWNPSPGTPWKQTPPISDPNIYPPAAPWEPGNNPNSDDSESIIDNLSSRIHEDGDPLTVTMKEHQIEIGPVTISFIRTLRIPEDGQTYPLPPHLDEFPIKKVSDYADSVPEEWLRHGGVFIPMYQREAMWLHFSGQSWRPNAIKVATGKINALNGKEWTDKIGDEQDYVVVPQQPWLDGINAGDGFVKQFVATPLGDGVSIEGQMSGQEIHGGMQIAVYEPKSGIFTRPNIREKTHRPNLQRYNNTFCFAGRTDQQLCNFNGDMGIAPGGQIEQKIYLDDDKEKWDENNYARVFVHLVNSEQWAEITGEELPETPVTAAQYTKEGLPWFKIYDEEEQDIEANKNFNKVKNKADKKVNHQNSHSQKSAEAKHKPNADEILYGKNTKSQKTQSTDKSDDSINIPKEQIEKHHLREEEPNRELDGDW